MGGIARRRGGGDQGGVAAAAGGDGEAAASGFSSGDSSATTTLRSPASSSLTDDGGEVTSWTSADGGGGGDCCSFSCSSESELELELESDDDDEEEEEEMMQLDGGGHAAGGPLYELAAPLLAQLPLRTGLSKYYQGKSQSFTSLCNARCVQDLAKKTTPYITRMKLQLRRGHGVADRLSNSRRAPGPCSKTMAKKATRCSSDRLLSRAREHKPLHSSSSTPAQQSKKELSRC
uniref:Uncharacterized protein n=1 Tax=Oryza barthii TaxID=65489 RepID=A0A0D3GHU9_9ORYZ